MQILFYSRDVFLLDRALIRGKSPTKWGVQMAGMNFKTTTTHISLMNNPLAFDIIKRGDIKLNPTKFDPVA